MQNHEELIIKLLDEVEEEYSTRYQWGETQYECMSLFGKIRSKIQNNILAAYKNNPKLSADSVLSIVMSFMNNWPGKSTECNDTDGQIHINSIYSKLHSSLDGVTKSDKKDTLEKEITKTFKEQKLKPEKTPEIQAEKSNQRKYFTSKFISFYIFYIILLFGLYIYLVG